MRNNLKRHRMQAGLKVEETADLVGISASFYYKIEHGSRNPTLEKAKDIANLFESTVDELFFDSGLDETSSAADAV